MSLRITALLLASVLWYLAAANTHETVDCCLKTSNKIVPFKVVKSFSVQTANGGCRIPATVLISWKGLRLCAPPAAGKNWVAQLIKRLKRRSRNEKKRNSPKHHKRHHGPTPIFPV